MLSVGQRGWTPVLLGQNPSGFSVLQGRDDSHHSKRERFNPVGQKTWLDFSPQGLGFHAYTKIPTDIK